MTITITGVNDAPDAQDDAFSTDEDTAISGSVLGNDSDPDDDNNTLSVTGPTVSVSGAAVTVNADGTFDYDPTGFFDDLPVGQTATDSFEYTLSDGTSSDTATVTITITGVNDGPIAEDDIFSTGEESPLNGNVLDDNGQGPDFDPEGDAFVVHAVNGGAPGDNIGNQLTLPSGALLTLKADGKFDYDPNSVFNNLQPGDNNTDSFTYTIIDEEGNTDSATATIFINSSHIGDAPENVTLGNLHEWEDAWTEGRIDISHKADFIDNNENYSEVTFTRFFPQQLEGGDIFHGDLGVSGNTANTSLVDQEIDGTEALKFELTFEATELSFGVSRFFSDDDNTGFAEAGRVLLLDENDLIVKEFSFSADSSAGDQELTVEASEGFNQVIFNAGATDLEFVFGAYADNNGDFATGPFDNGGTTHGSDYLLDYVEFSFDAVAPAMALGVSMDNVETDILLT